MNLPDRRMPKLAPGVLERQYLAHSTSSSAPTSTPWPDQNALKKRSVGRPRSERVEKALELLEAGIDWRNIYPQAFGSRWRSLKFYERTRQKRNLRRAVRAVLKRKRQKLKAK